MARSISAFAPGNSGTPDIRLTDRGDLEVAEGVEDVRQRVIQRLRFQIRESFLRVDEGVPYRPEIFTAPTSAGLASVVVTDQVRSVEGVDSVTAVSVSIDPETRVMTYAGRGTASGEAFEFGEAVG